MRVGGCIVDYLSPRLMLHDTRHDVSFVGYQARGTPGHATQAHGSTGGYLLLNEARYNIGVKVHAVAGYSAHADQQDLLVFFALIPEWPSEIRIAHDDSEAESSSSCLLPGA